MKLPLFFLLFFLSVPHPWAANLIVELNKDLPSDISRNIQGYLGDLPNNDAERSLFVFNAKKKVSKALQAFGYYRPDITINLIDNESNVPWRLNVQVTLNQATIIETSSIIISGAGQFDEVFTDFLKQEYFKQGEILNHGKYEQLKVSLTSLGLKHGYFDAKFIDTRIAIHQSYHSAKIFLHYDSGKQFRLGEVNFNNIELNPELLTQLTPFKVGEPYHVKHLRQLQNQLEQTQYFSNIVINPKNNESVDGVIPIDVNIEKAKSHRFDFGVGYATDTELRLSAGWETPLVNRYGHKQSTKITYSQINPVGEFHYSIPLSHPLDDLLQFEVRLEDDVYGDLKSKYWSTRLSRVKNNQGFISEYYLRYLKEDWQRDSIDYQIEYFLPGLAWSKVTRGGDPINPTKGFSQYYNIEFSHNSLGAETNLFRLHAKWKYITTVDEKHRFVTRAEIGALEPDSAGFEKLAPSLRFFAGGDQSIRGFAYQSIGTTINSTESTDILTIGGTRLAVASIEYQYQFAEKWRSAVFLDGGSAYKKNALKAVYSVGPGIHYLSPIGAIRFELGYSLSKDNPSWRFHFNLGTEL
ncbi:MAG: autotransporter assembly complex protein TamA [Thalassotalea sp.]